MPGTELTLDEILADPIVRLLMQRDGVREADIRALSGRWRRRPPPAPQAAAAPAAEKLSTAALEACLA